MQDSPKKKRRLRRRCTPAATGRTSGPRRDPDHQRPPLRHCYFGLNKGVVAYTLLANHVRLNARIIGANEHESHFVFDVLFNNATDILPAVHSTDTHGTNPVNFALLHQFGYRFAPRYRNVQRQVESGLCGFHHPTRYDRDWPIKPNRRVREGLILSVEANIERILLSPAFKTTTQSVIVEKLSAYRRKNRTKRALWELDSIIRTLYLLNYIDSPVLRRKVQKALNRGEAYHQPGHRLRARRPVPCQITAPTGGLERVCPTCRQRPDPVRGAGRAGAPRRPGLRRGPQACLPGGLAAHQRLRPLPVRRGLHPDPPGPAPPAALDRGGVEALCWWLIATAYSAVWAKNPKYDAARQARTEAETALSALRIEAARLTERAAHIEELRVLVRSLQERRHETD